MEDEFEEVAEETPELEETLEAEETEQPEEAETTEETEEAEPEAPQGKKQQPVIPRKAYESEKEKRQALEREVKELREKAAAPAQPAQTKQPQTIEEYFDVDPAGTLAHVDKMIRDAQAAYDMDEAQKWKDAKTDLVARGLLSQQTRQTKEGHVAKVNAEIYKSIPDFDSKRPELVALAEKYGLTSQEAEQVLDPSVVGDTAARMAKMLNKVHAVVNAGKTAKTKEVKQPTKAEPAGNGGFSNNNTSNKQLQRAKESGNLDDWASLLG